MKKIVNDLKKTAAEDPLIGAISEARIAFMQKFYEEMKKLSKSMTFTLLSGKVLS